MSALRQSLIRALRLKDPTPDAELLRAAAAGETAAFPALVARHGPMVLRVCRQVLGDQHEAEDAFQAVFLLLSRRLGRLNRPERLAAWLFGVARRTALNARTSTLRRRRRETRSARASPAEPLDELTGRELLSVLDEEIERLPEAYRLPLLLCYWQGLTQNDIARRLGWSASSVKGRLERGRKLLATRLTKRGLAPSVLLVAVGTPTIVSAELLASTAALALPGAVVPAGVLALVATTGIGKGTTAMLVTLMLASASAIEWTNRFEPPQSSTANAVLSSFALPAPAEKSEDMVTISGRVLDPDGKPAARARVYTLKILPGKELFISHENVEVVFRTNTESDGQFHFDVPKDKLLVEHNRLWPVMAAADGYGLGWSRAAKSDDVLTIRLVKDEPITGRVLNTQGRPVPNAKIRVRAVYTGADDRLDTFLTAWQTNWQESWGHLSKRTVPPLDAVRVSANDREGRFTITGAGADRIVVFDVSGPDVAVASAYIVNRAGFDVKPLNQAAQILRQGERRVPGFTPVLYGSKLDIVAEPAKTVGGIVRDADGKPVAEARVETMSSWGCHVSGMTDANGHFTLGGLAKRPHYLLRVTAEKGDSQLRKSVEVPDTEGFTPVSTEITLMTGG
jgi:RNA polymerase sigma factor (sigma-70 family)